MERRTFLTAAAAAATAVGALGAMPAQARLDEASDRNIHFMTTIISAVINDLNQDAHDYGGHRVQAISSLETAVDHLNEGLSYEEAHGRG